MTVVVPDSIEVVEGWRSWNFGSRGLTSITRPVGWLAGTELEAECGGQNQMAYPFGIVPTRREYAWSLVQGGMSPEKARAHRDNLTRTPTLSYIPPVPSVMPITGMGWVLISRNPDAHTPPGEDCTCGIYAAADLALCPPAEIYGKVKLWGKVIPGEHGWRAQYAYPSVLYAPPKLAAHPALLAYGVEVVVEEHSAPVTTVAFQNGWTNVGDPTRRRLNSFLAFAVTLNLCGAAFNVTHGFTKWGF